MKDNKKNNFAKRAGNTFFWAIVIAIILGVFWSSQNFFSARLKDVPISDVIARANKGEISKIEIQGNDVKVTKKGEKKPTEKSVKEAGTIYEQGLEKGKTTVMEFGNYDCSSYCDCSFIDVNDAFSKRPEFASYELWKISSKNLWR